ncbi:unnamed protein product [Agarophyton chilense]|eukprot:gb/GEZJ01002542.1/.p1 GENE.gb/GEZJ01002542.1/~~gb/GEZJ01002542.1/.p1  ORF type:complete len:619 (+),score=93.14 gb/GEZJ01002542.1/:237-2093(+)
MSNGMSGTQPPKPALFSKRRRRVQKRRRVLPHFDTPDLIVSPDQPSITPNSATVFSCDAAGHSPASSAHDPARVRPYSLRVKPRMQTRLKQAPLVPGYDPHSHSDDATEHQISYTQDQLRQLKKKLRIAPQSHPLQPATARKPYTSTNEQSAIQPHIRQPTISGDVKSEQNASSAQRLRSSLAQSSRPTELKQKSAASTAAPFSLEWNAQVYDDDDIQIEPLSNFSSGEVHGNDSESADGEWEAQLIRRAVQKTTLPNQFMFRRELNMIQDAEIKGMQSGAFIKLKLDIAKRIEELAGQQAYMEQTIGRLGQVARQDTKMDRNANVSVKNLRQKVAFYEHLVQQISNVSRCVAASIEVFEQWESFVDGKMAERINQVIVRLKGGIDQFRRERNALVLDIEEVRCNCREWGGRLVENVQKEVVELRDQLGFKQIIRSIMDWVERFPEDYKSAFADSSSGRLLGRLALLENDIGFIQEFGKREEMTKAVITSFGVERFASWIKARWEPRVSESCEFVGDLMRSMNAVPSAKGVVRSALQARLELEIEALEAFSDEGIRYVVRGLVIIAKKALFDPGLVRGIHACERICGLKGFEEELAWMADCSFLHEAAEKFRQWLSAL